MILLDIFLNKHEENCQPFLKQNNIFAQPTKTTNALHLILIFIKKNITFIYSSDIILHIYKFYIRIHKPLLKS